MTSSRWAARFGALAAALSVAAVATAVPAAAEPVAEQAVEVTATFDKPSYQTGDRYEVTITVRNGADVAADIHYAGVSLPTEGMVISKPLALSGSLIPAGESRTQTFEYGTSDNGAMHVAIQQRIGGEVKGTKHDFTIPVTPRYIDVTGVVYADEDGDSAYDAGEEVPGVEVTGRIAARTSGAKVTTDSAGRFSFPRLLTLRHAFEVLAGPEDVLFSTQFVNLHEATAPVEVRIRGIVERGTTTTTTATSTTTTTATTTPGTSAPTTTTTTPAPQAGRPPLADTGANTSRLTLGGVLVLAAGVAMVVLARRRRA